MTGDRLTTLDASFVWLEHPGTPVHVGAVTTFEAGPLLDGDGTLRLGDLRDRIDARLDAFPRLRRRLATVPLGLDRPRWVDDPSFDIARHVRACPAPAPGDDRALRELAAHVQSKVLPRDRPLWDLLFVTGLDGDRVGLVERVHHSLVDGVSGVDLAALMLDVDPDAPPPARPATWVPGVAPGDAGLVAAGLGDRVADAVDAARAVARAVRHPAGTARSLRTVASGLGAAFAGGLAPRTSLNARPAGGRRLAWVRTDLDEVRAAGRTAGASANDVVLGAVAGGLRTLLLARGEGLPSDLVLSVLVPVSLRADAERGALGNRVGAILAPLPVGIGDPTARLERIRDATRARKDRAEGAATGTVLSAADLVPPSAAWLLAHAVDRQRFVNLVVTNVPGPPEPLYAAGARMLEAFPVVPLGANLSVGVAVLSYAGALTISVTADERSCPDVDTFAAGIVGSLAGMGVAASGPGVADVAPPRRLGHTGRPGTVVEPGSVPTATAS
jgi:WS/DGAT/MGAT family acyltransferase